MASAALVDVRRVNKTFDRGAPVWRYIPFQLGRGEMVALIGASGSGKSTLIRAIAGLEPVDADRRNGLAPADGAGIDLFGLPMQRNRRIMRWPTVRAPSR